MQIIKNFFCLSLSFSLLTFSSCKLQFFPHFFNTAANQEHIGAYPPPDMYGCDYMHPKDREEFYDWYHRTRDGIFDFK